MAGLSSLILTCGVVADMDLLAAIVRVESRGNPLALAVNGTVELVRPPRDRDDAVRMARWLASHGYNFDAGVAQVNSANFARLGLDAASVFEPCANLRGAAIVLEECRGRALQLGLSGERADSAALSCYNTGHLTRGVANGYVAAVRAAYARAVPSSSWRRDRAGTEPAASRFPGAARRPEVFAVAVRDAFAASTNRERER
jgi:type IV secretion system protein VirB1